MNIALTKESRKVLKSIYDLYCYRRKEGKSRSSAVRFDDWIEIDGLSDAKSELDRAKLIKCDIVGNFELTDDAIILMENFTKDTILKWIEFGANFIP